MPRILPLEHNLIPKKGLKSLINNRISTILDFLQEDVEKLCTITKLTLPQILTVRSDFIRKYSASLVNGSTLVDKCLNTRTVLSTGIVRLDSILNGGIPLGYITEICGLARSGKTTFCTQLCINCLKDNNCNVLYIDTKGDFSAVKLQKLLQSHGYSHKDMALTMQRVKVVQVWAMDELIELFMKLKKRDIHIDNLCLILIDSLPSLMFQYLGDDHKVGLTSLNIFANYCKYLCREYNLSILCVNTQTRWIEQDILDVEDEDSTHAVKDQRIEKRQRCLGKYWQHIPALVLLLEIDQDKNENLNSECNITVTVHKSNLSINNVNCVLALRSFGIS